MSACKLLGSALCLAAISLTGCGDSQTRHAATPAARHHAPLSRSELPTTNGAIAMGNLEGQIDAATTAIERRGNTAERSAELVDLLLLRGQFRARIVDYERAAALSQAALVEFPQSPLSHLSQARVLATFHRFPAALTSLEKAEQLGARASAVQSARAGIWQGLGKYDEALAVRAESVERRSEIGSLSALAGLRAERGEIDAADQLFIEAPYTYRDVAPFPVAWNSFQHGLMWMREGRLERARELLAATVERLPQYAPAAGHLGEVEAALGHRQAAIELLQPLAETSDDPDYGAQLARILAEAGEHERSQQWRLHSARRYDELTARYPEAFADHAAEFWLAAGNDPQRALFWARRNLEVRQTPRAYELLLNAAIAAADKSTACATAAQAKALRYSSTALRHVVQQTQSLCATS